MRCEHDKPEHRCSRCRPESTYQEFLRGAKRRRLPCPITEAEYIKIVSGYCAWCNDSGPMSVDRVDSTRRYYSAETVQPLCKRCQQIKWSTPESEVWTHLKRIIAYRIDLSAAAALAAGYIKPEQPPQADQPVQDEQVGPDESVPEQPEPRRPAPSIVHAWDYLDPAARAFFEG
jgi:hypothetical protein